MLQIDIETWAYRLIRDAQTRRRVEDNRAELKANWPEARRIARQLAGHANAAGSEPILWLFGVDEHSGVVAYASRNMADWKPQLDAEFEGVPPAMQHFALHWNDKPFEALVFRTDAPPYVVKNPRRGEKDAGPFQFDVPWREGTTRSARRAELLLMLRPIGRAPAFTPMRALVQLLSTGEVFVGASIYAESPELARILIRDGDLAVDFGSTLVEMSQLDFYGDGLDPDVVRTRSQLVINGAGKIVVQAHSQVRTVPAVSDEVVMRFRFAVAAIPQPVSVSFSVPRAAQDGSMPQEIAIWKFGTQ